MALLVVPLLLMRPSQAGRRLLLPRQSAEQREPAAARPSPPRPVAVAEAVRSNAAARGGANPVAKRDETARPAAVEANAAAPRPVAEQPPRVIAQRRPRLASAAETQLALATAKVEKPALAANDKCSSARPGVDKALCKDDNLAALDRLGEAYYGQSVRVGSAAKRAALKVSRDGFLGRREACRSDSCLRDVYLAHMKEISAIVENKQPAPR